MKTVNVLHRLCGLDASGVDTGARDARSNKAKREALAGMEALFAVPKGKIVCPRFFSEIHV